MAFCGFGFTVFWNHFCVGVLRFIWAYRVRGLGFGFRVYMALQGLGVRVWFSGIF